MLPRKDYAAYYGPEASLLPGHIIDCVVTKAAAGDAQVCEGAAAAYIRLAYSSVT